MSLFFENLTDCYNSFTYKMVINSLILETISVIRCIKEKFYHTSLIDNENFIKVITIGEKH